MYSLNDHQEKATNLNVYIKSNTWQTHLYIYAQNIAHLPYINTIKHLEKQVTHINHFWPQKRTIYIHLFDRIHVFGILYSFLLLSDTGYADAAAAVFSTTTTASTVVTIVFVVDDSAADFASATVVSGSHIYDFEFEKFIKYGKRELFLFLSLSRCIVF